MGKYGTAKVNVRYKHSALASNACYSTSDAYVPGGNACGDMFEEMRSVETIPSFGNVNTCAVSAAGVCCGFCTIYTWQKIPILSRITHSFYRLSVFGKLVG